MLAESWASTSRGRKAVRPGFAPALLGLLKQAGDADFDELIQIAGGDGQKLHAFEEGIVRVERFFEDAAVELQPGKMAVKEKARVVRRSALHCYTS